MSVSRDDRQHSPLRSSPLPFKQDVPAVAQLVVYHAKFCRQPKRCQVVELLFLHVYEGITCICRLMIESLMVNLCTSQSKELRVCVIKAERASVAFESNHPPWLRG